MDTQLTRSSFPGFSKIHVLGHDEGSREFRGEISPDLDVFAITRGEHDPGDVVVRWVMGRSTPSEVVSTTHAALWVVADRVIEVLRSQGFSGWKSSPIEVFGKNSQAFAGYQALSVHGRCGRIDNSRSVKFDKQYPARVAPAWRGLYFDEQTWDGSHLFIALGRGAQILVVDDVKRALENAKVKRLLFTPLDEYERSDVEMRMPPSS